VVKIQFSTRVKIGLQNWKKIKKEDFIKNLNTSSIHEITVLLHESNCDDPKLLMNNATNKISHLFQNTANLTFKTSNSSFKKMKSHCKPWLWPQCNRARHIHNNARKEYQLNRSRSNKHKLFVASRQYRKIINTHVSAHNLRHKKKQDMFVKHVCPLSATN
jgi:hypothetical protein